MYDNKMLKAKKLAELIEIAEQIGLKDTKGMKKQELIDTVFLHQWKKSFFGNYVFDHLRSHF